jgi:hypothetical protein
MIKKGGRMARHDYRRPITQYKEDYISTGKWIATFILLMIPGINIIAFLVWVFGGGKNSTRTNFIRASLLFAVIWAVALTIVYFVAKMTPLETVIYIKDWIANRLPF